MKKLLVGIFAVAMVVVFRAPVIAADWNFYGSARMTTFSRTSDTSATDDQRVTDWKLQSNSRFGANVKTNDNGIGGGFEYGTGVNLRKLYGTWDFGGGEILIGQTYTPTTHWISNQVFDSDQDLYKFGHPYAGRQPMIRLKTGGLQFALIAPNTPLPPGYAVTGEDGISGSIETTIPKIEAHYHFKTDMFYVRPYAGYNTYVVQQTDGRDRTLDSWLGGLSFGVTPGAFYFKGGAFYALNPSAYGIFQETKVPTRYDAATSEISDIDSWGIQAVAGFKINDGVTIETGYGLVSYDEDTGEDFVDREADTTDWTAYLNASITFSPGFFVVPEFGYVDREDIGENDNNTWYLGAKWQINF